MSYADLPELEPRKAAWEEVARRISHEIKNSLTPISLSLRRIRGGIRTSSQSSTMNDSLSVVEDEVRTLETMANEFSLFITGNLYSRTVLSLQERQMVACAALAAIRAGNELRLHVNAALNVGCDPQKLTETFFQIGTYAGMPAVNEALDIYRGVLKERGQWPLQK